MKSKNDWVGVAFLALGALLSAGTAWWFPTCGPTEEGKWMSCHWAGRATIGLGLVIVAVALLYLIFRARDVRAGLSLALIPVGALGLWVLNGLIGLCARADMQCRALTKPAASILLGGVVLLAAANAALLLRGAQRREKTEQSGAL